jgi:RES domain
MIVQKMPRRSFDLLHELDVDSWRRSRPCRCNVKRLTFRHAGAAYPPLWLPGSTREPTLQPEGRWHRDGREYTQYFALSPRGAWAELIRYEGLRLATELEDCQHHLWWFEIEEKDIADLSSFNEAHRVHIDPGMLVDDNLSCCQALGSQLRAEGYRGVLAPSAALPGERNLTLFGPRREFVVEHTLGQFAQPSPEPGFRIVTTKLAEFASPPAVILDDVRYPGESHLEFAYWKKDRK